MPDKENEELPNPWAGPPRDDAENPPPPVSAIAGRSRQVVSPPPSEVALETDASEVLPTDTTPGSLSQRLARTPANEVDSLERVGVLDTQLQPEAASQQTVISEPSTGTSGQTKKVVVAEDWPDAGLLLANEQTFLSWIRTSATLMLAGVLLASFATDFDENLKQVVSVALISIGMFCGVFGWLAWRRNLTAIQRGRQAATARLLGLLALAIIIVGAALVAGIWLATQ
ncbi:MAG: hypothetical protein RL198_377 [Actinomycetota bacterium]|jgi:uncharacterized membrane protein YidH (DUF202 family)